MKLDPRLKLVFLYLGTICHIVTTQANTTVETTTSKQVSKTEGISDLDRLLENIRIGFITLVSVTGAIFLLGLLGIMMCNLPYFERRRRRKQFTLSDETGLSENEKRPTLTSWYQKRRNRTTAEATARTDTGYNVSPSESFDR